MNEHPCGDCRQLGAVIPTMNQASNPIAYCAAYCMWRGTGETVAECEHFKEPDLAPT